MQNHYNLIYREEEREMIPQCLDMGLGVLPWSPLARGLVGEGTGTSSGEQLTTRSRTDPFLDSLYQPDLDVAVIDRVGEIAAERSMPAAQVALAWLLHKPGVTAPIVGATKIEHVEDALAAEALSLSEDEIERLEAVRPASRGRNRALSSTGSKQLAVTCPDPPRAAPRDQAPSP